MWREEIVFNGEYKHFMFNVKSYTAVMKQKLEFYNKKIVKEYKK